MKIGAPYIYVQKLDERKKTDYDVHVSVMLDDSKRVVGISQTPSKCEDGIAYHSIEVVSDENLTGANLFHVTLNITGKDPEIKHIRIEVPHEHMGATNHHTGGSGSFEP